MHKELDYILWVEDSLVDIKLVKLVLKKANYKGGLEIINYGKQVLPFLEKSIDALPKLMILDLRLPDINGLEILKKIKSDKRLSRIPVMVRTGIGHPNLPSQCKKLGADYFIEKGVDLNDVIRQVKEIMKIVGK